MQLPVSLALDASDREQPIEPDTTSASAQAERLRDISGLPVRHLAKIFGVSRTTYSKWLSGSPLHSTHREHLLEALSLVEEVVQHLGSSSATNTWLLTPVSPGGKKPIDYLEAREYTLFHGFLLRTQTGREVFRPLAPSHRAYIKRSQEELEDALERLKPRAWIDDEDMGVSAVDDGKA
jgi:transcriptional regulator with XRE-family HTH domain